jgi:small conductance mechanosensitive channel
MLTTLQSLLVLAVSFQVGQPAAAPSASSVTPAATIAVDPLAPLIPDKDTVSLPVWERAVRSAFTSLHMTELDADAWMHIAEYYGLRALFVLVLMSLAWTASSWSSSAIRTALARVKFDETLSIFLAKLVRWSILLLVGMTCLSYFGVETTGFAAIIGAAGLAIGLAFQGTLSNFAAGAMLLIFRPYKVGDLVTVAGHLGKVCEIELFTTAIDTLDRRRIIIPNSSIYGSVIENATFHAVRRVDVPVGVAYSADIDQTRAALERALRSVPDVVVDPAPEAALLELGASSVNWSVRGYAPRDKFGVVKQALIRAVKIELDRDGIGIPFPQLDIHFDPQPAEEGRRAA